MKQPKTIKIIANNPLHDQDALPIEMINQNYEVIHFEKETEEVTILSICFDGGIVINKNEYEILS